jgi:small-conductance mechanosensitive channel
MDQIAAWLVRHHVGPATLVATIVILVAASIVIVVVDRLLKKWLRGAEARIGLRSGHVAVIARVVTTTLWLVALLLLLDLWGIGVGGLWATLASVAAVIGVGFLANWAMISNITASLLLAIWRPYRLGDTVEMLPENLKGRAVDRNLMFTALREEGGTILQIPNNLFFQKMFRVGGGGN